MALELNIIRVLPLLRFGENAYGGEVRIKYFLIQAWGSALFLSGFLLSQTVTLGVYLVVAALVIKLGAAPLHLWFIRVLRLSRIEVLVLLSTVQKVIPMLLLQQIGVQYGFLTLSVWARALVAGWGAFNHTGLRVVLAYSSIFTVAWCLGAFQRAKWLWLVYLLVYSVSLMVFVSACTTKGITRLSQLYLITSLMAGALFLFLTIASIGGLPPIARFWVKIAVLERLLINGQWLTSAILLRGSVWILYLYMRVAYFSSTCGVASAPVFTVWGNERLAPQIAVILGLPLLLMVSLILLRGVITWSFDLQDLRET